MVASIKWDQVRGSLVDRVTFQGGYGLGPGANKLQSKRFQMALTSTRLHVVERDLKTVAASVLVFKAELNLLPALLGGSQDQQVGPTQAPFKLLLRPWVLEHVRFHVHT